MSEKGTTPNDKLIDYLDIYLNNSSLGDELEARFGTKAPITQIQFDAVIGKLKSLGFKAKSTQGDYHLNISPEFVDPNTGYVKISNVRVEINDLHSKKKKKKKNTLDLDNHNSSISFVQKKRKTINDSMLAPIDYNEFGFRINYKWEKHLRTSSKMVASTM